MDKLRCIKCGYEWFQRTENEPKECPNCKTRYWNREKIEKQTTKPEGGTGKWNAGS